MITAYITHDDYQNHTYPNHPEHSGRIRSVWNEIEIGGLSDRLSRLYPSPATNEQILSAHLQKHLEKLIWINHQEKTVFIDQDTYALPDSFDIARLAAGGVIKGINEVLIGKADNALVAVRPPGHHATPNTPMGFCLINNVAVGARYAQSAHNIKKVLIIDYDVHHGNGTQDIFYSDDSVMFISIHQSPFYPGTGHIGETGKLEGHGYTLNIPISGGFGDDAYKLIFDEIIWKSAIKFSPDLILISAGFDAHWADPLANMRLSLSGYDYLARECIAMAKELCNGNIVFVMEGGYDLKALGHGWRNIAHALLGEAELSDPYGQSSNSVSPKELRSTINQIKLLHGI